VCALQCSSKYLSAFVVAHNIRCCDCVLEVGGDKGATVARSHVCVCVCVCVCVSSISSSSSFSCVSLVV